jgi:hypothetical protein
MLDRPLQHRDQGMFPDRVQKFRDRLLDIKTLWLSVGKRTNERSLRPSKYLFLRVEGVVWSEQRIPMVVNLEFLDRSCYCFFQVALQLCSRG